MYRINIEELKKGDMLYKITDIGIIPNQIKDIDTSGYYAKITFENGSVANLSQRNDTRSTGNKNTYFVTEEEAKNFMYKTEINKEKKKKMFEYEKKLNEELGIETFLINY